MSKYLVTERSGRDYPPFTTDEQGVIEYLSNTLEDDDMVELREFLETASPGDQWDDNWVNNVKCIE